MLNRFLNLLFPSFCPLCKKPSMSHKTAPICHECWEGIPQYQGPQCLTCGTPLPSEHSTSCGECTRSKPTFHTARSYGLHSGILKETVNLLKFHGMKRLSKPLSEKLIRIEMPNVDIVVPVPLHRKRLRMREYNQSALIAKHVARHLEVPIAVNTLIRIRETRPQVGLNAQERRKNIRNAFSITDDHLISGKQVLLLDDVYTTGATVRECSRILRKAGARDIFVITLTHGAPN